MFDTMATALQGLRDELDALVALDPAAFDDVSLTAHLVEARRQRHRLDGVIARLGAAYRSRRVWAASGARSAAAHLASLAGEPLDACRADLWLARALASMPRTAAALAAGSITRAHAERLARAASGSRAAAFAEGEEMLLGLASRLDGHDFDRAVRYWMQRADDVAAEDDATERDRNRWLGIAELADGRRDLRAMMTAPAGAEVAEALRRHTDELFEADWARARQRLGRTPTVAELERTPAQRRHDALVLMARRSLAAPADGRLPRPLITFHVGADQAMFERLCELSDGTVVTPGEVARQLGVADLERVIRDAPDRVRVSERTRLFRGAERRAVELRDRYCTFPGCRIPSDQCEIDHVIPHADGGATVQENGRPGALTTTPAADDPNPGSKVTTHPTPRKTTAVELGAHTDRSVVRLRRSALAAGVGPTRDPTRATPDSGEPAEGVGEGHRHAQTGRHAGAALAVARRWPDPSGSRCRRRGCWTG
jgi:hypothetical protein